MHGTRRLGLLGMGLMIAVGALSAQAPAAGHTDFTGAWKLNPELTQRPTRDEGSAGARRGPGGGSSGRMPGGMGGMGGGGRGPGGMGGGGYGGGGGGRGRGGNPEEMARTREAMRLAMLMPDRLTIVRDDKTFVITDGEGVSQKLTPGGKGVKSQVGALDVETKTKWDDAVMVVERKFEGGVKITDRYWITESPRQLVIASKVENNQTSSGHARELQRVYDPIDTNTPAPLPVHPSD